MSPVPRTSRCSSGANEATRPKTTPCLLSSGQPEPRPPPSSLSRSESALCCAKVPAGCLANLPGRGGRTGTKFTAVTSRQAEGGAAGRERQGSARSHAASLPFTNFRHSSGPRCLLASRGQGHAGSRRAPAGWGLCPPRPLAPPGSSPGSKATPACSSSPAGGRGCPAGPDPRGWRRGDMVGYRAGSQRRRPTALPPAALPISVAFCSGFRKGLLGPAPPLVLGSHTLPLACHSKRRGRPCSRGCGTQRDAWTPQLTLPRGSGQLGGARGGWKERQSLFATLPLPQTPPWARARPQPCLSPAQPSRGGRASLAKLGPAGVKPGTLCHIQDPAH